VAGTTSISVFIPTRGPGAVIRPHGLGGIVRIGRPTVTLLGGISTEPSRDSADPFPLAAQIELDAKELRWRHEAEKRSLRHQKRRARKQLEYLREVAECDALRLKKQRRRQRRAKVKTACPGAPIRKYYAALYTAEAFAQVRAMVGAGAVVRDVHIDGVPVFVLVISAGPLPSAEARGQGE
jgi:hypothetical protein